MATNSEIVALVAGLLIELIEQNKATMHRPQEEVIQIAATALAQLCVALGVDPDEAMQQLDNACGDLN